MDEQHTQFLGRGRRARSIAPVKPTTDNEAHKAKMHAKALRNMVATVGFKASNKLKILPRDNKLKRDAA